MAARARTSVALGVALAVVASDRTGLARHAQQAVFRADVEAVRVEVSVTRGGVPVAGLTAAHFDLVDNGVPQVVDRVSREDIPLNLMLVLDSSGSLEGEALAALITAAQDLVRSLSPTDRVGLLTFSQRVEQREAPTLDRQRVLAALGTLVARGPTALRDALFAGLHALQPDPDSRPVVVLFTDGRDTASWTTAEAAEGAVRRSGVVLHAVELAALSSRAAGAARNARNRASVRGRLTGLNASPSMQRLVRAGGGRIWSAASPDDLKGVFAGALSDLRARYLLTYTPRNVSGPGWHDVIVRLKGARGDLHARPGYFVP